MEKTRFFLGQLGRNCNSLLDSNFCTYDASMVLFEFFFLELRENESELLKLNTSGTYHFMQGELGYYTRHHRGLHELLKNWESVSICSKGYFYFGGSFQRSQSLKTTPKIKVFLRSGFVKFFFYQSYKNFFNSIFLTLRVTIQKKAILNSRKVL
eukprot:TRINITY_DN4297_c0_g1_i5.p3 TRINITY_DN4297_c0_g1~~TRINITY_DN4297_c0_g1_i5.p3  ORF type:complete len:154 (+),score=8.91 TRINITY_DN4297_c0_g1_i5:857-1318(+)